MGKYMKIIKESLLNSTTMLAGRWLRTDTSTLSVGDRVRWKKGRGYSQHRESVWNVAEILRQTPSGYFVTSGTPESPKGKRFKPQSGKYIDKWSDFEHGS